RRLFRRRDLREGGAGGPDRECGQRNQDLVAEAAFLSDGGAVAETGVPVLSGVVPLGVAGAGKLEAEGGDGRGHAAAARLEIVGEAGLEALGVAGREVPVRRGPVNVPPGLVGKPSQLHGEADIIGEADWLLPEVAKGVGKEVPAPGDASRVAGAAGGGAQGDQDRDGLPRHTRRSPTTE